MTLRLLLATILVCVPVAANSQDPAFDPAGAWEGPCQAANAEHRKYDSRLFVEFRREGKVWRAKGGLRSPGRPSADSEFEEVKIAGDSVAFVGLWGPTIAEFQGTHQKGVINGKLEGKNDGKVVFSCSWSVTRQKK